MGVVPEVYTLPSIEFIGGGVQKFLFHVYKNDNKTPLDVSGGVCNFAVRRFETMMDEPILSRTFNLPATAGNLIAITLDAEDTLDWSGRYVYQLSYRDVNGIDEPPSQGILYVTNNINKEFVRPRT